MSAPKGKTKGRVRVSGQRRVGTTVSRSRTTASAPHTATQAHDSSNSFNFSSTNRTAAFARANPAAAQAAANHSTSPAPEVAQEPIQPSANSNGSNGIRSTFQQPVRWAKTALAGVRSRSRSPKSQTNDDSSSSDSISGMEGGTGTKNTFATLRSRITSYTVNLTRVGRKRKAMEYDVETSSASSSAPLSRAQTPSDEDEDADDEGSRGNDNWVEMETGVPAGALPDHEKAGPSQAKQAKTTNGKRDPYEAFVHYRDIMLREMLRHEGLKSATCTSNGFPVCRCGDDASIRCTDCSGSPLTCADCAVEDHARMPLHRVEIYNGQFFAPYSLNRAGLCVQLGHDGGECPHPVEQNHNLTVIDVSGIHSVHYALCGCYIQGSSDPAVQVLRASWFPATVTRPRTVVTFATLRLYHALAIQGRINLYDFYNGLVRITDNVLNVKSSYKAFIRAFRMFRNLRAAKRTGRGQSARPLSETRPGEIALRCPACPIPGVNLPTGWEDAPPEYRFLYALYIAIDANFKLKLKDRIAKSVPLADGWSFLVASAPYATHLRENTDLEEMKQCTSEYNALRSANITSSKRWAVNGVGAAICARHLLYRAQGVVDLPRGERYACMDYAVFKMLGITARDIKTLYLSYDIVCEWCVNFFVRLRQFYPDLYELPDDFLLHFVIPKFHIEAHGEVCKAAFNLNHTVGAARTCGEGIEAGWADMNAAGVFTREMSAAHRQEVIDDFMQAINWRKIKTMSTSFVKALEEAIPMAVTQRRRFDKFANTLPKEVVDHWELLVREWDETTDKKAAKKDSPYHVPVRTQSLADVKLELAQAEAAEMAQGVSLNEMTASTYITSVITLEDQKYNLDLLAAKKYTSSHDQASLQIKQNQLHHRAQLLEPVQSCYVLGSDVLPAAVKDDQAALAQSARVQTDDQNNVWQDVPKVTAPLKIEFVRTKGRGKRQQQPKSAAGVVLWLPSNITDARREAVCNGDLIIKEIKIRIAICHDSIHNIRRALRTLHAFLLCMTKSGSFFSQKYQLRSVTTRRSMLENVKRHAERYRRSWNALCILDPENKEKWADILLELKAKDLKTPDDEEDLLAAAAIPDSDDETTAQAAPSAGPGRGRHGRGKKSEGRKEISWVWLGVKAEARDVPGVSSDATENEVYEHVRIDYLRARSRSKRWEEQVAVLLEEMVRVTRTHVDTVREWEERAAEVDTLPNVREDVASGMRAHAFRQANIYLTLAINCVTRWEPVLRKHKLRVDWPECLRVHANAAAGKTVVTDISPAAPSASNNPPTTSDTPADQPAIADIRSQAEEAVHARAALAEAARTEQAARAEALSAVLRSLLDGTAWEEDNSSDDGDSLPPVDGLDDDGDVNEYVHFTSDEGEDDEPDTVQTQ
ncbi:hypothetical protein PENSPDRAFT_694042 [Peniophora sp. CONT]|nr:hypothetical protein PENSPDRAFT_694042 [Peniophora sp. CONT]